MTKPIENYTKRIELKPNDADAYNNRGIAYKNKGDYDRAIADFQKALEKAPNNKTAKDNLEIALQKRNQISNAAK